jgi:hypothetical protein
MTEKGWLINIREKDNFVCHSKAGKESHTFIEFLAHNIKNIIYFDTLGEK